MEAYDRQQREGDELSEPEPQDERLRRSSPFSSKLLLSVVLVIAVGVVLNFLYQEYLSAGPAPLEPEAEATPTSRTDAAGRTPATAHANANSNAFARAFTDPHADHRRKPNAAVTTQEVWLQVTADGETVYVGIIARKPTRAPNR